ncbi:hypothetical protein [Falsiruegeria litorea]|uniref:hypothetical protein n=1 Tax=Falsiruegeria litorea TaxID=1280831 RepID=UPI001BFE43D6|nr:hypothetical protein [Falsiruegeria litorea]MBT8167596.1 hypothetical protein [Falsiruegeria litorea]
MSMPAAKSKDGYDVTRVAWRGIGLEVRHCRTWSIAAGIDHIEVVSDERAPLPITETGYRSHFIMPEEIAEIGTPLEYVIAWLDYEAQSKSWIAQEAAARQLNLF